MNYNFLFAKDIYEIKELENLNTNLGKNLYKAPEVQRREDYTQKADIYSLGKSFYELCCDGEQFIEKSIITRISLLKKRLNLLKNYLNEMLILKKLDDPSVIKCYQIFEKRENK